MSGLRRLRDALRAHGDARWQGATVAHLLDVVSVERDDTGVVVAARGTIEGAGDFTVPVRGEGVGPGMQIYAEGPIGDPLGALKFAGIYSSDDPTAGYGEIDPDLPAPLFAATPWTTAIVKSPGSITARVSVFFVPISDRYRPTGYYVSWKITGGEWQDIPVIHLGGAQQECNLGSNFKPGQEITVKLRTRIDWAFATSVAGSAITFNAAADTASPGNAFLLTATNLVAGQILFTAFGSVDPDLLDHWQYEINTTGSGAPTQTVQGASPYAFVAPANNYYARVRPVSHAGVLGGVYPSSGYAGPFTLFPAAVPDDTTPPGGWAAPTLTPTSTQFPDATWHGFLEVTLPTHSYEADYAATEVSIVCDDGRFWITEIPFGKAPPHKWEVGFGQFTVALRGRDKQGNRGTFGTAAVATIAKPALSSGAPVVGTQPMGAGIEVHWTGVINAQHYEVQRASDAAGTGAATVATVDSLWWLDVLLSETIIQPTYWYRVRAVGIDAGAAYYGAYSTWVSGTAGKIDAQNLRLGSIVAGLVGADQIRANHIRAGEIDATKLAANLVITQRLRTANSGARWEIVGHDGVSGDQDQIRLYDGSGLNLALSTAGLFFFQDAGAFYRGSLGPGGYSLNRDHSNSPRMTLTGSGLTFYNDSNVAQLSTGVDAGQGYLASTGGFQMRGDYTMQDFSNNGRMRFYWGPASNDYQDMYLTSIRSGGTRIGFGMAGYRMTPGGIVAGNFFFVSTTDPLNPTTNLSGNYTQIAGGVIATTGNVTVGGEYIVLGPSNLLLRGNPIGTFDSNFAIRQVNADGSATKLYHSGVSGGNLHMDWSHGNGYLGWFSNPGHQVVIGNGAGGTGQILASAFTVSSDRAGKTEIEDAGTVAEAFDALQVRRYRRVDDDEGTQRVGLIADEVIAAGFPELVIPAAPVPDGEPVPHGEPIETGEKDADGNPIMVQPTRQETKDGGAAVDLYGLLSVTIATLAETRAELRQVRESLAALEARAAM